MQVNQRIFLRAFHIDRALGLLLRWPTIGTMNNLHIHSPLLLLCDDLWKVC
jgi:hypothetical protein